jgi:hypothetical protein
MSFWDTLFNNSKTRKKALIMELFSHLPNSVQTQKDVDKLFDFVCKLGATLNEQNMGDFVKITNAWERFAIAEKLVFRIEEYTKYQHTMLEATRDLLKKNQLERETLEALSKFIDFEQEKSRQLLDLNDSLVSWLTDK